MVYKRSFYEQSPFVSYLSFQVSYYMNTIINSLHNTPQQQKSYHQLSRPEQTIIITQDSTQQTQPTYLQSYEGHIINYVSLWWSRAKHRTLPADVQTTPGTETANTHKGTTAQIIGGPTEDRHICCGDWHHSSIKANDKRRYLSVLVLRNVKCIAFADFFFI